jgi:acyl dehydratase
VRARRSVQAATLWTGEASAGVAAGTGESGDPVGTGPLDSKPEASVNLRGEPARVGHHCGSSRYEITPEGVAFYADALDDRHAAWQEFAPPLLHHSECYRHLLEWYLRNVFGNLHGRQEWWCFAPIRVGSRVRTRSTIVERYSHRGRDWVVNETDLCDDADGRLLVRGRTHQSFLPPGSGEKRGFVVDQGSARAKAPAPEFPTASGPDLPPVTHTVDLRRCWMFSGPVRNYHTDREEAKKLGFPDVVVQGMMSTCFVSKLMHDAFGPGWLAGGHMSVKLTNVLWVDETVTTRARVERETPEGTQTRVHCQVWIDKQDGTRILAGEASALR